MKEGIKPWMLYAGLYVTVIASLWTYYNVLQPKNKSIALK